MNTWADGTTRIPYVTADCRIDRKAIMEAATRQAKSWQAQHPDISWKEAMKCALQSITPTANLNLFIAKRRQAQGE